MGVRVLVAEDEALIALSLADLLQAEGHDVALAADGAEALDAARGLGDALGVLVTDLNMPRMCGEDLIRALRAERPGLPVVVVTGAPPFGGEEALRRHAGGDGPLLLLHKPHRLRRTGRRAAAGRRLGRAERGPSMRPEAALRNLLRGLRAGDLETVLLTVAMAAEENRMPCADPDEVERILGFLARLARARRRAAAASRRLGRPTGGAAGCEVTPTTARSPVGRRRWLGPLAVSGVPGRAGPGDDLAQRLPDPLRPRVAGQHLGLIALGDAHKLGGQRLSSGSERHAGDAPVPRVRCPRHEPAAHQAVEQFGHGGLLQQARLGQAGHRLARTGDQGGQHAPHRQAHAALAQFRGEALDQHVRGARQQVRQELLGAIAAARRSRWVAHLHRFRRIVP